MSTLRKRLAAAALTAGAVALLLPTAGQAAQVFGSGFVHEPNQTDCEMLGPCTVAAFVEIPAEGQVVNGGAPIDGVITKFRIRAKTETPAQVTFRVADVSPEGANPISAMAASAGTGPTVTLQASGEGGVPVQEFAGRLPVKKGQHLAIDAPSKLMATYDSSGTKFSYEYAPPLAAGSGARTSNQFLGELLVQGTVEPDADGDGFGDETQDGCPSQATTQGACDVTKPAIGKLRVRKGKISYKLSEASAVSLRLAKKNGHKFKPVGRIFSGPGNAGSNQRGLPRAKNLAPGVYRLSLTATDVAGNKGTTKTIFHLAG